MARPPASGAGKLGTFRGVFAPSVLTILGIILFLRLGWLVGGTGLRRALLVIALAHVLSILTSISLAVIATSRRVRGGGDYYLISRSLGLEYGASLGVVLFLAQSVAVAFYCFGFGEAVANVLPPAWDAGPRVVALTAAGVLFVIAVIGADLATRLQLVILTVLIGSLVVFFAGALGTFEPGRVAAGWDLPPEGLAFGTALAIFFPAVTGFTQGVSLSGDLADPGRSLPRGTFAAVGVSLVVYTAAAVAFAGALPLPGLRDDYFALKHLSIVPWMADAGVIAATLSSALASFLGAPRILQAMAGDDIFPTLRPFAVGHGPSANPRRGVLLTAGIALGVLLVGNLNAVAALISMFFLISYALLNYATYIEARGASPSFRPRFRFFDARLSLVGGLGCLGAMVLVDPVAAIIALAILTALYQFVKRTAVPARWADRRRAFHFRRLKDTIREIDRLPETEWTWQPHVLAFAQNEDRRDLLVRFGQWISGASGLNVAIRLVEGTGDLAGGEALRREAEGELRTELEEQKLDALPLVVSAPDLRVAVATVLQTWGIGPVRANTVLVDWYQHLDADSPMADPLRYGRQLRSIVRLQCNALALDVTGREWRRAIALDPQERRIDVWWWGERASSRLGLLFAYLMTRDESWEEAVIRIVMPCPADRDQLMAKQVRKMLEEARIDAELEIVPEADAAKMVECSRDATVVFLPLPKDGMRLHDPFGGELEELLPKLPITCLVSACRDVALTDPEPEEEAPRENDEQTEAAEKEAKPAEKDA